MDAVVRGFLATPTSTLLREGPLLEVNTSGPIDFEELCEQIKSVIGED